MLQHLKISVGSLKYSRDAYYCCPDRQMNCYEFHDDVIKWKHFPRYWPFVRVIHRSRDAELFFDLRMKKPLSKQWSGWWFETLSRPLWRHCNVCTKFHSSGWRLKIPAFYLIWNTGNCKQHISQAIDISHISTMHQTNIQQCNILHIFVTKWCFVVCETGALRDLCDKSIVYMRYMTSLINHSSVSSLPVLCCTQYEVLP